MNTVTQLRNTETNATIVLDTNKTKAEQYRDAVLAGCPVGKTSFTNLSNAKIEQSKGWVYETVEVKPAPVKKAAPLGIDVKSIGEIAKAAKGNTAPRRRRDMGQVFEAARKGQHKEWVNALESAGFALCVVEKNSRWLCFNLQGVETSSNNARVDISPLKNGNFNFSLYNNGKACGVRKTLEAANVTPANIVKMMQEFSL